MSEDTETKAALPQLGREERKELHARMAEGGAWKADFVVMLCLSSALASFGLLQNSGAVIIGAMLVAPLMTPLIGAGHALAQGNAVQMRECAVTMLRGVAGGLAVAAVVGLLTPSFGLTTEVQSRGLPNALDLAVALLSGAAAAYASARPDVAATMAGVAIAAALMPPLAVVGIAAAHESWNVSLGAALLLATNLVAIVLGASFAFRLVGVSVATSDRGIPPWARRASMTLAMLAIVLSAPLVMQQMEQRASGQSRPYLYPVARRVSRAAAEYVQQHEGVHLVMIARSGTNPSAGVGVMLTTDRPLDAAFRDGLEQTIRKARGSETPVLAFAMLDGWDDPTIPEEGIREFTERAR